MKWLDNMVRDFKKFNLPLYKKGDRLWGMRGAVGNYQEGRNTLFNQGLFEESSTAKQKLGTIRELDDGRVYVYGGNSSVALTVSGNTLAKAQTPVDCTIAAADAAIDLVGAREITLTIAGATADLYKDGFIIVKAGTDIGSMYKVRGNVVTGNPATGRATFTLYDKLYVTWVAATTTVAAHQNPWHTLVIAPAVSGATATTGEHIVGITTRPVTASYYAWFQTKGIGCLITDGALGDEPDEVCIVSGTTAGHGLLIDAGGSFGYQVIAHPMEGADLTAAEGQLVMLCI